MKPVNLPRLRCAMLGLLPFGERRAQRCSGRTTVAHALAKAGQEGMKTGAGREADAVEGREGGEGAVTLKTGNFL